jgi:hypothetical protein
VFLPAPIRRQKYTIAGARRQGAVRIHQILR